MVRKLGGYILTYDTTRCLMKAHGIEGDDREYYELERAINNHLADRGETKWRAAAVPELNEDKREATRDERGIYPDNWMVFINKYEYPKDGESPGNFVPLLETDKDIEFKNGIIKDSGVEETALEWVSFWDLYCIERQGMVPQRSDLPSTRNLKPLTLEEILAKIDEDGRRFHEARQKREAAKEGPKA